MTFNVDLSGNEYIDPRLEQLFETVKEGVADLRKTILEYPVDALEAEQEGHGNWGICKETEFGESFHIWVGYDLGTLILKADGSAEVFDNVDDDVAEPAEGEDAYDHFYRILSDVLPDDMMPDKLDPLAGDLVSSADELDDEPDEDD